MLPPPTPPPQSATVVRDLARSRHDVTEGVVVAFAAESQYILPLNCGYLRVTCASHRLLHEMSISLSVCNDCIITSLT